MGKVEPLKVCVKCGGLKLIRIKSNSGGIFRCEGCGFEGRVQEINSDREYMIFMDQLKEKKLFDSSRISVRAKRNVSDELRGQKPDYSCQPQLHDITEYENVMIDGSDKWDNYVSGILFFLIFGLIAAGVLFAMMLL